MHAPPPFIRFMVTIGILGGVASGKSAAAEQFRRLGAEILDADRLGHRVLQEPEVIATLRERWGAGVVRVDPATGREAIDRRAVAEIVFAETSEAAEELRFLEGVTHPRITDLLRQRLEELEHLPQPPLAVVLDAPLLMKAGWDRFCDLVVFIDADRELRLARAAERGWTEVEFDARERRQAPLEVKRCRADRVLENNGTPEALASQINTVWQSLTLPKST